MATANTEIVHDLIPSNRMDGSLNRMERSRPPILIEENLSSSSLAMLRAGPTTPQNLSRPHSPAIASDRNPRFPVGKAFTSVKLFLTTWNQGASNATQGGNYEGGVTFFDDTEHDWVDMCRYKTPDMMDSITADGPSPYAKNCLHQHGPATETLYFRSLNEASVGGPGIAAAGGGGQIEELEKAMAITAMTGKGWKQEDAIIAATPATGAAAAEEKETPLQQKFRHLSLSSPGTQHME